MQLSKVQNPCDSPLYWLGNRYVTVCSEFGYIWLIRINIELGSIIGYIKQTTTVNWSLLNWLQQSVGLHGG